MNHLSDQQLRDELRSRERARRIEESHTCAGVAASFCPVHGDCTCPANEDGEHLDGQDDDHCPLHSAESSHAEASLAALGIS